LKLGLRAVRGLLASLNVQFWKTEDSWRLDGSYRWRNRRDIPCLVDATDVRTLKTRLGGQ
jgi:hypothetical protein